MAVVLIGILLAAAGAAAGAATRAPVVTLVGDSVAAAIGDDPQAVSLLSDGVDLRLELAPCRRLETESCPHRGTRAPTVLDLVGSLGARLGDAVVVAVGYNDPEDAYAREIDDVVAALRAAGVPRILWLTLREVRHPYVRMNDAIRAAAARTGEITVVDWNARARTFPGWFAEDGIHLQGSGARSLAAAVRIALGDAGVAPPLPPLAIAARPLPAAAVGRPLDAPLAASGGVGPYRWKRVAGALPPGLHVERGGAIAGVPRQGGRFRITVRVTDAVGSTAERPVVVSVGR